MMRYHHIVAPHYDDQMSMDLLHARMIGEYLRRTGINRVVEVGCCWGVSTAAVLEALTWHGCAASYVAIDPEIKPTVRTMLDDAAMHGVDIVALEQRSLDDDALNKLVDSSTAVILDGDHDYAVVREETDRCLLNLPACIIYHDCGGTGGGLPGPSAVFQDTEGSWNFGGVRYRLLGDRLARPGMRTERGLGFADSTEIGICRDFGAAIALKALGADWSGSGPFPTYWESRDTQARWRGCR